MPFLSPLPGLDCGLWCTLIPKAYALGYKSFAPAGAGLVMRYYHISRHGLQIFRAYGPGKKTAHLTGLDKKPYT